MTKRSKKKMTIRNRKPLKKKVAKKKAAAPKKPTKSVLDSFPKDIRDKALTKVQNMVKSGHRNSVRWKARDTLPSAPRKNASIKVKQASMPSVGGTYYNDRNKGSALETFLKRVSQFAETAQGKGATKIFVSHNGVVVTGYREETDAEFKNRRDNIELERAFILTARSMQAEIEKKEEKEEEKRAEERLRNNFVSALQKLPKKEIDRLLKKHLVAKKEPPSFAKK